MEKLRLRFAPSPTGALHIGGVRTALYNYLLAKKHNGSFLLRIEDTDQNRYVPGAEEYIVESLKWIGIIPDEGPGFGGNFGPYRQSERKALYSQYALELVEKGYAYYAFDTAEELEARRQAEKEKGNHTFKYDSRLRKEMKNSLTLPMAEVQTLLENDTPYTIRLKIPEDETIIVNDLVRGDVAFQGVELDDKIILKADGMPTYHLANIVDDHLMEITHVIRGEEWLPSTAHHVLLYRFLNWESQMPKFAHLPLILKPNGKGKLGKRDGNKFGIPVFPLSWDGASPEDSFKGFREFGFNPKAVINFLAFLGWNPGTEQEIFSVEELIQAFSIEKIGKAGARFDYDKATWFNQQYIIATDNEILAKSIRPIIEEKGYKPTDAFLSNFCGLMKERVNYLTEFWEKGYYFFEAVSEYDEKTIRKRWKSEKASLFKDLRQRLSGLQDFNTDTIQQATEDFIAANELSFGAVFPFLRIAMSGTTKGPAIYEMMELLGQEEVLKRWDKAFPVFDQLIAS